MTDDTKRIAEAAALDAQAAGALTPCDCDACQGK